MSLYPDPSLKAPLVMIQASSSFRPPLPPSHSTIAIPKDSPYIITGHNSRSLLLMSQLSHQPLVFRGHLTRTRVLSAPTFARLGASLPSYL